LAPNQSVAQQGQKAFSLKAALGYKASGPVK